MVHKYLQRGVAASLVLTVAALLVNGSSAVAGDPPMVASPCYFAQPGAMAPIYPSPLPTPPLVGRTYITYQPLLAQEFLYDHGRTYLSHQPGAGASLTHVHWSTRRAPEMVHLLFAPRGPMHMNNKF